MVAGDDPTLRMLRSGFGKQVTSPADSNPAWGFGTAHRDAYQKLYLSQEQSKAMQGNNSQGPVYKSYEAIGPQPESKFETLPAPGFGTSTRSIKYGNPNPGPGTYKTEGAIGTMRDSRYSTEPRAPFGTATRDQQSKVWLDDELMKINFGKETPGPCQYTKPGGLGKQTESQFATQPAFKTGNGPRFTEKNGAKDTPGAGSYKCAEAFGKQALSNRATGSQAKMGTSQRDAAKKIFISREHEKSQYGELSPGPATAPVVNSFGSQKLSVKKTYPSWGFGTSKRPPLCTNDAPGPGSYWA